MSPAKPAAKVATPKTTPAYTGPYYNQAGKPDPNGLYDRDKFQVRFDKDVKKDKFTKQDKPRTDTSAARKAGYAR